MAGTSSDPRPSDGTHDALQRPNEQQQQYLAQTQSQDTQQSQMTPQPSSGLPNHPAQATSPQPAEEQPQYRMSVSHDREYNEKHSQNAPFPGYLDRMETIYPQDSHEANLRSPHNTRAEASRLDDDLELLRAERFISNQEHDNISRHRTRPTFERMDTDVEDHFNPQATYEEKDVTPKDENAAGYKVLKLLKKLPRFVRYFLYLLPGAALLMIPILLGIFAINQEENPVGGIGGPPLFWFGIWLQIVWGSLWVSRMITSLMPHIFHSTARIGGSTNAKKWKEVGHNLELHTALFLWMLAVLISYNPIVANNRVKVPKGREDDVDRKWIGIVFKVIIAIFVLVTLNFVEKIIIQWIAEAFHTRTYATRIENNKGDIRQLVHLFEYAKGKLEQTDEFWQGNANSGGDSGSQTPMQTLHDNARQVLGKVGQVAGKVGNDFIGRKTDMNHPRKVVAELLRTTGSSHTLARLIYRSLVRADEEMVFTDDMLQAFQTPEEADAAFNMFDKDMNGDISIEEFETVTNEISLEKKSIAASLKDLDSVIKKLDKVFFFIIFVIAVIVFISIISGSAAAGLASAGSSVLGLAWMLQATAQEFLQSIIFVFVKHPFDVGDRVTIYGSTGEQMTGDDYYVTEISLLYTEFKKMQGHVVQAPNSLLNTLFILNQRRSNGLASPTPIDIRFATPQWMIDELKARMLDFVKSNRRDFQPTIIFELSNIIEMRAARLTVVFIHKTNFQNELLRLNRHSKFMMELMYQMNEIGIQSPFRIEPGGSREHPVHWASTQPPPSYSQNDPDQPHQPSQPEHSRPSQPPQRNLSMRRPSITSGSSARANMAANPSLDASMTDFQDVFSARRDHFQASRLASIKEKNHAAKKKDEAIKDNESEPRGSTSALAPTESIRSQTRNRAWGRYRSNSRAAQHQAAAAASDNVV